MLSISLGPLALPVAPLLLLGSVWAASMVAGRLARRPVAATAGDALQRAASASQAVFNAALCGLLAARLAHLALNADAYAAEPWAALDPRDGGWHAGAGAAGGALWLLWRAARAPSLRRALAAAAVTGLAIWLAASALTGRWQATAWPAQPFIELASAAPTTLAQAAAGRPLVVNLWASWCGPCRQEMPTLAAAQQRHAKPGAVPIGFVFVNQGEPPATVQAYLARERLALQQVLLDPGSSLGPAVGSKGLPTTLFYDAGGRLVDAHFGVLNPAALTARLRTLSTGMKAAP